MRVCATSRTSGLVSGLWVFTASEVIGLIEMTKEATVGIPDEKYLKSATSCYQWSESRYSLDTTFRQASSPSPSQSSLDRLNLGTMNLVPFRHLPTFVCHAHAKRRSTRRSIEEGVMCGASSSCIALPAEGCQQWMLPAHTTHVQLNSFDRYWRSLT